MRAKWVAFRKGRIEKGESHACERQKNDKGKMENRGFDSRNSPLPQLTCDTKHKRRERRRLASEEAERSTRPHHQARNTRVPGASSNVTVGQHVHVHVRHGLARELAVLHAELEAARLVPGLEHALHLAH